MDCRQQSGMLRIIPQFVVLCQMFDKMLMRRVNNNNNKKDDMSIEEFLLFFFFFLIYSVFYELHVFSDNDNRIIIVGKLHVFNYYFRMCKVIIRNLDVNILRKYVILK